MKPLEITPLISDEEIERARLLCVERWSKYMAAISEYELLKQLKLSQN